MSVSEKLKGLGPLPQETRFWPSEHVKVVWAALPQIVAVVEAAERQVRESHEDDVDLELAAALAALDETLS